MTTTRFRSIVHNPLFGVFLMYAFTWSIDLMAAAQSRGLLPFRIPTLLPLFIGYGFVAAALLATALDGGRPALGALLRRYTIWRVRPVWWAVVLLGPAALVLAALAIDVLLGAPLPDFSQPFVRNFVPAGLSMLVVVPGWFLFEALTNGEEIGWRGYLLPRLLPRHGARVAALLVGLAWAPWHLPKFWLAGTVGSAHDYPFWLFTLNIVAFSVLITWVFQHTRGSLLVATAFHAAMNTASLCLPIEAGSRAFTTMIVLMCAWAVVVALATGPGLTRRSAAAAPEPAALTPT